MDIILEADSDQGNVETMQRFEVPSQAGLWFTCFIGQAGNIPLILSLMTADRESFESWDTVRTLVPDPQSTVSNHF